MAHHINQVGTQMAYQLMPHLMGTAGPAPTASLPRNTAPALDPSTSKRDFSEEFKAKINEMFNKGHIPTEEEFYAIMNKAVQPGALLFWSGLGTTEGLSSKTEAEEYATYFNLQLLRPLLQRVDRTYPDEMIFNKFKGQWSPLGYNTREKLVDETFARASRAFARHVKGRAIVILKSRVTDGTKWPHPKDCWVKDEWETLIKPGSGCTEIVRVSAENWKQDRFGKVIWTRNDGEIPMAKLQGPVRTSF